MGLKHAGYVLDVALLGLSAYLLSRGPLASDVLSRGPGVLATMADGAAYQTSAAAASLLSDPAHRKWFDFVLGDNLGHYATLNRDAARFTELDGWLNGWVLPAWVRAAVPHMVACFLRNLLAAYVMYYALNAVWCWVIYRACRDRFFPTEAAKKEIPSWDDMLVQISVSSWAMPMYSLMPTLGEWLMERGLTQAYLDLPADGAAGLARYLGGVAAYLFLVEWGIYWVRAGRVRVGSARVRARAPSWVAGSGGGCS